MTITIDYSGRLEPQAPERETVAARTTRSGVSSCPKPTTRSRRSQSRAFLYSNMSYWYPQSTVTDYATATIQITVPAAYGCIATGEQRVRFSADDSTGGGGSQPRKVYAFSASRPLRYFSFLVGQVDSRRSMDGGV